MIQGFQQSLTPIGFALLFRTSHSPHPRTFEKFNTEFGFLRPALAFSALRAVPGQAPSRQAEEGPPEMLANRPARKAQESPPERTGLGLELEG